VGATVVLVGLSVTACDPERDRYGVVTAVERVLAGAVREPSDRPQL
jgi:hypothetical protein